jgi:AcrR family transcriptional regulator
VSAGTRKSTGLRERKRQRTRTTIVRVALELFAEKGYETTTLAEIAEAADVGPSTLYAYFPSKDDILFSAHDAVRQSARTRILERPAHEAVADAMRVWITDELPPLFGTDSELVRRRRATIDSDESLQKLERMRLALLEDMFAQAFADELGETADDLRSRLMASVAVNGFRLIWSWWYEHLVDERFDPAEPLALDATYLTALVKAAEGAIELIPSPPRHFHAPVAKAG